jgi:hypothetical protein
MIEINHIQTIKDKIENMNKCYQIGVLKILKDDTNITLSENNNGTFINLTDVNKNVIKKLESYIEYVNKQQNQLTLIEEEKIHIKNEFFKQNKKIIRKKNKDVVEETPN